jgi:uncharacterized protein
MVRSSRFYDPPVSLDGAINDVVVGEMNPAHSDDATLDRWADEAVRSRERQEATAAVLGARVSSPAIPDLGQLLDTIKVEGWGDVSISHGWEHWNQVARIGLVLAREMPAADPELIFLFALLHDAQRMSEDHDPEHGERATAFAHHLNQRGLLNLDAERLEQLAFALTYHDKGFVADESSAMCSWDADRLTLWRCGIKPNAELLGTEAAKRRIDWARTQLNGWTDWQTLLASVVQLATQQPALSASKAMSSPSSTAWTGTPRGTERAQACSQPRRLRRRGGPSVETVGQEHI